MIAVSTERVLLREIDLTRHVKTPAGVKYFHKPIGSPIGGGTGHRIAKDAERVAKTTAAKAALKSPGTPSKGVRKMERQVTKDAAIRKREPGAKYKVRIDEGGKVSVNRENPPEEYSKAPLTKGEAAKIEKILNDARTPDDIHAALLHATMSQKYHIARRVVQQHKAAQDYVRKNGDQLEHGTDSQVARFYQGLFKIVPWIRGKVEDVRTSDHAQRLKDFKYVESLLDATMDSIIKIAAQGALMGVGSLLGAKLLGG